MTSSDYWQQVKILLEQAADLPGDQQHAYLASVCSDDAVRREVLELLRADAEPDRWSRLTEPQEPEDLQTELSGDQTAHRIGRYIILRQIGAGGMGSVFLAQRQDEDVVQTVAVKLIQSALFSETALALFRRERRILAALDHPGICPLIDSGMTDDGRPYLVMPYLEGAVPVTEYCDQHDLNDRLRAKLFIDICQAVHHAHQNLVVHSDIKPANVMITPEGRVQLLDFGIARMLRPDQPDPTLVRAANQPVTLDYASPEQLRGDVATTQSDVYALGVLLHQLLAGDKPWQLDDTADLHAQIDNRSRAPRQGRRGRLPEDVYNIVGKATAMESARRYGSVQALAEDVDAWMTHRPVRARAPGWRYLATRFVQRHRWPVALMASLLVAAVALVSVMTINAARIAEQADQIAAERDRAQATARFWVSLFDQTDPVRALSPVSGLDELLDRATELLERDEAISPNVRAQLLGVISTANWNLVRPDPARLAAELGTQLAESEEVNPIDRALAWKQLANIAYAQTDVAGARLAIDRALAELQQADSPDPASQATILSAHALTLDREGRTAEAAEAMQRAVDLQQQVPMERIRVDHAIALSNLAWIHFSLARAKRDWRFARAWLKRELAR